MNIWQRFRNDERGSVIVLTAFTLVALLGVAGIALDMGRIYIERARISNVADAGALAAARSMRQGQTVAKAQAIAIAAANGFVDGSNATISVLFGTNSLGEKTATVGIAARSIPLILLGPIVKRSTFTISTNAVAAVLPIDMTLVLDQSSSLEMADAWDDLKVAASNFLALMDDQTDQVGLVSFHLRAINRRPLQAPFAKALADTIRVMNTVAGTNLSEGLTAALAQMSTTKVRQRSVKVIVVFTDGQPNAFRAKLSNTDRILMADAGYIWGYWNSPDLLPKNSARNADGCEFVSSCFGYNPTTAEKQAVQSAIDLSAQIRAKKIYIYTIGLGNPNGGPWLAPDLGLLRTIANDAGVVNKKEPMGKMYFAPTKNDLADAFQNVARDLLTRLAQ